MRLLLSLLACFLSSAACAAVNNTFVNNDVYNTWLADADYANALFLPSDNQKNGVAIHWTLSDNKTTLNLAVAVEASGWVGFGVGDRVSFTAGSVSMSPANVFFPLFA